MVVDANRYNHIFNLKTHKQEKFHKKFYAKESNHQFFIDYERSQIKSVSQLRKN